MWYDLSLSLSLSLSLKNKKYTAASPLSDESGLKLCLDKYRYVLLDEYMHVFIQSKHNAKHTCTCIYLIKTYCKSYMNLCKQNTIM